MKILFINSVSFGSTGNICKGLAHYVNENGGQAYFAFARGDMVDEIKCYKINTEFGVNLDGALSRLFDNQGFNSTQATKKLIKYIKSINPEVIHLHNLHGYYLNIKILMCYLKNEFTGKLIFTLHDCWLMTGHCCHFTNSKCEKWMTGCHSCGQISEYPKSLLLDKSKKNWMAKKQLFTNLKEATFVCPSEWLRSVALKSYLSKSKIICIKNGISLKDFDYESLERHQFELFACSFIWNYKKGQHLLADLMDRLGPRYRLYVAGLTKSDFPLRDNIIQLGEIKDKKVISKYFKECNVFVNPSLEDTFPTVNIEAQSFNTPTVCFDICGCKETIDSSISSAVEVNNMEEFAKAVKEKCENLEFGCSSINGNVSNLNSFEQYLQLYKGGDFNE